IERVNRQGGWRLDFWHLPEVVEGGSSHVEIHTLPGGTIPGCHLGGHEAPLDEQDSQLARPPSPSTASLPSTKSARVPTVSKTSPVIASSSTWNPNSTSRALISSTTPIESSSGSEPNRAVDSSMLAARSS